MGWKATERDLFPNCDSLDAIPQVKFVVVKMAAVAACANRQNPLAVLELLNCLGFVCYDTEWETTRDELLLPKPGAVHKFSSACGGIFLDLPRLWWCTTVERWILERWTPKLLHSSYRC